MQLRFKIVVAMIMTSVLIISTQLINSFLNLDQVNDESMQDDYDFVRSVNLNILQVRMNRNQFISDLKSQSMIGSIRALQNTIQKYPQEGTDNDDISWINQNDHTAQNQTGQPIIYWNQKDNISTIDDLKSSLPKQYKQMIDLKPLYLLTNSRLIKAFRIHLDGITLSFKTKNFGNYDLTCVNSTCINQYSSLNLTSILYNQSMNLMIRSDLDGHNTTQLLLNLEFTPNFPYTKIDNSSQVTSQGILYNNTITQFNSTTSLISSQSTPLYQYFQIQDNQTIKLILNNFQPQSCPSNQGSQFSYKKNGSSIQQVTYSQIGQCSEPANIFYIQLNEQLYLHDQQLEDKLQMIFSISLVVSLIFILYVWRKSVVFGLSVEVPVQRLVEIMGGGFNNLEEEELTIASYEDYFNSSEIQKLFMAMIHFVNNIKYSNNKLWDIEVSEAQTLIKQSKSKQFYQHYGNLGAVGICASNISRIHMKNKRYLEAMNEQEESILIGNQEIQGTKEYQDFVLSLANKTEGGNIIQILSKFKNKLTQRFKRMDDQWIKKFFNRGIKDKKSSRASSAQKTNSIFLRQFHQQSFIPPQVSTTNRAVRIMTQQHQQQKVEYLQVAESINEPIRGEQQDMFQQLSEPSHQSMPFRHLTTPQLQHSPQPQVQIIAPSQPDPQQQISPQYNDPHQKKVSLQPLLAQTQSKSAAQHLSSILSDDPETQEVMLKLFEVKQEKQMVKMKVVYRKYQLASILFNYSLKQQELFLNESINLFKEIFDNSKKLKKYQNISLFNMQINILTKQAFCHSRAGQIEEAQKVIDEAVVIFEKLKTFTIDPQRNEDLPFIDIFKAIPLEIQQEKILSGQGILDLVSGEFHEAANKFVQILDTQSFIDPAQQQFAQNSLRNLFNHFNLETESLDELQQKLSQKKLEIIVLIDYTAEMTTEQLILSHSMSKFILDEVSTTDEIGLYAFNEIIYEAFPIQRKGTYRALLDQTIQQLLIYPGGSCNLFKILQLSAAFLFDTRLSTIQRKLKSHLGRNFRGNILEEIEKSIPSIKKQLKIEDCSQLRPRSQMQLNTRANFLFQDVNTELLLTDNKPKGDDVDSCIGNIFNPENNEYRIEVDNIDQEDKDYSTARYIFLFAQGVKDYSIEECNKLKKILQKKNINLVVFNVANQNANMLYLKLLSKVTEDSRFLTTDAEISKFIKDFKEKSQMKKLYLEFF